MSETLSQRYPAYSGRVRPTLLLLLVQKHLSLHLASHQVDFFSVPVFTRLFVFVFLLSTFLNLCRVPICSRPAPTLPAVARNLRLVARACTLSVVVVVCRPRMKTPRARRMHPKSMFPHPPVELTQSSYSIAAPTTCTTYCIYTHPRRGITPGTTFSA